MMINLDMLKGKLDLLRTLDKNLELFGASEHKYQLNSCLSLSELEFVEKENNIELPADYRDFILHLGNGGAGPYYGIFPLEKSVSSVHRHLLTQPFLYTSWWNGIIPPDWWNYEPSLVQREQDYFDDYHLQGTFRVAHEGSGYYQLLVLTGSERGHIWGDYRASDGGIMPIVQFENNDHLSTNRLDFISWYESWLDFGLRMLGCDTT
jgi:hypothetical protein